MSQQTSDTTHGQIQGDGGGGSTSDDYRDCELNSRTSAGNLLGLVQR